MEENRDRRITVIGAGITGSVLAMSLADRGHGVHLIERRADPTSHRLENDRSINLALSHRGLLALGDVGLADPVVASGIPMRGRMIHDRDGGLTFQPYGSAPEHHLVSVSRNGLNRRLIEGCRTRPSIELSFDHKVEDVDLESGQVTTSRANATSGQRRYDVIFGTDGAYSAVRQRLQRTSAFDFEQDFLEHGYKELTIPAAGDGGFRMEPEALHIWPRGSHMLIALPNPDGSFTCTLFWPHETDQQLGVDGASARAVFAADFADALDLMPDMESEFDDHPVGTLLTTRCQPWNLDDRILLLGDAAHAVVPFYGQGANAGLEDVSLLVRELDRGHDWTGAFDRFARGRKPDTDALAQLALDNYVEMRDHVASRWFLAGKWLERLLHRLFPQWFTPLYTMVTFTSTPYAEAVQRARRQQQVTVAIVIAAAAVVLVLLGLVLAALR
ncbi:MAG: FAD-dependent oxidoreductase [Acidimicrobiales bacterium]